MSALGHLRRSLASSQNWHLYYRLRQSYGDQRLVDEAAGHVFLDYEEADFVSFLQIGILAGWDMWLVPQLDYGKADTARIFVSHDESVEFFHRDAAEIARWRGAGEGELSRTLIMSRPNCAAEDRGCV